MRLSPLVRRLAAHLLFNSNPEQITKSNAFNENGKISLVILLPPGITAQEGHSLLGSCLFDKFSHTNDLGITDLQVLDSLEKLDQKVKNTTGSSYKREIVMDYFRGFS